MLGSQDEVGTKQEWKVSNMLYFRRDNPYDTGLDSSDVLLT
jgi:hypothetical protein